MSYVLVVSGCKESDKHGLFGNERLLKVLLKRNFLGKELEESSDTDEDGSESDGDPVELNDSFFSGLFR